MDYLGNPGNLCSINFNIKNIMKIPAGAKKMFDGIIFDVYHFDLERYDGSTATFEKLKRANTLITIATVGDKIIVTEDSQPHRDTKWTFPGGRQEEGENELTGAKRELLEETGYASDQWELFKTYTPYNKIDWEIKIFIARNCQKKQEANTDPGEKVEMHLMNFEECINLICTEKWMEKEFALDVLRLKCDDKLSELKNRLFTTKNTEL